MKFQKIAIYAIGSVILFLGSNNLKALFSPTDILLSNNTVAENQPTITTVGTLSTEDPDMFDSFTYSLVGGFGDTDNSRFFIDGDVLKTNEIFDFESQSSFSIRVRTVDFEAHSFDKNFTITVTNVNEAPTNIILTSTTISEGLPVNTVVGSLSSADPDAGSTFTYELATGTGDTDNGSFNISGTQLRSAIIFDFETKSSYSIRLKTTDNGGLDFDKEFLINVTDLNEDPTDILLTPDTISEKRPPNTVVGTLTSTDPDGDTDFDYTLLTGNSNFTIIDDKLQTDVSFDYESATSHTIRIRSEDNYGGSFEKNITVNINNKNDSPILGGISGEAINFTEGGTGVVVASGLTITDPDNPDDPLVSATVFISSGHNNTEDSLYLTSPGSLEHSFNMNTGILSLTGTGTLADYQSALRSVQYVNTDELNPSTVQRQVSFEVFDGTSNSNIVFRNINIIPQPDPPYAHDVVILEAEELKTRQLLHSDYEYFDPEGDAQVTPPAYKWYTANTPQGTGSAQIAGAVSDTFTTRFAEGGKYIRVAVSPRDASGFGPDSFSVWKYVNDEPVLMNFQAINETHPGVFAVGETVKADYDYSDKESDAEGVHTWQWYSNTTASWTGAAPIPGATQDDFTITSDQLNDFIALQAIPKATEGSLTGAVTRSAWHSVGQLPTATFGAGNTDTLCGPGFSGSVQVVLTGNDPWTFRYVRLGTTDTLTRSGITGSSPRTYTLGALSDSGTYKLVSVSDSRYSMGVASGTAKIVYYKLPSAQITTSEVAICPGDMSSHFYNINLTGSSPWRLSIKKQGTPASDSIYIPVINTSPYSRSVSLADSGTYTIMHVWDKHCMSTGTGSVKVEKRDNPQAVMSGNTTFCPGSTDTIQVALTGDGPWTYAYRRGSGDSMVVNVPQNVSSYVHNLIVNQAGTYSLVSVRDQDGKGCISGSAVVQNYTLPTAAFTGTTTEQCEQKINNLSVTLGGTAPWSVSYRVGSGPPVNVDGITSSPHLISVAGPGTYTLEGVNDLHCANTATETMEIVPAPEVTIGEELQDQYLYTAPLDTFTINPPGGNFLSSSLPSAVLYFPPSNEAYLYPVLAFIGGSTFTLRYSYQDPTSGCWGEDEKDILIRQDSADVSFKPNKAIFCFNEDTIKVLGGNAWNNVGEFSIDPPGALIPAGDNRAYIVPSLIANPGLHKVTYEVVINDVPIKKDKNIYFDKVVGDFTWDNECFGENGSLVTLKNNSIGTGGSGSGSYTIDSLIWNIHLPGSVVVEYGDQIQVNLPDLASYPIELFAISKNNCIDTALKNLQLKPTYKISSLMPYEEDFQDSPYLEWNSGSIAALDDNATNNWTYGRPAGGGFNNSLSTERAWYTNITESEIEDGENSYVISPCFDFTDARRPMLKMDIWRQFTADPNLDGAVLQYTENNGNTWHNVGTFDDGGINWFNSFEILGQPGGQNVGWMQYRDTKWVQTRHKLDELNGKVNVRFRVAYGSPSRLASRNGIAFDNFRIVERSKKVLLEHFTNAGDESSRIANEALNARMSNSQNFKDIIDLQYHMGYPGNDPFFDLNIVHLSSRATYYGIGSVPYSIIDGGRGGSDPDYVVSYASETLEQNVLTQAALDDNKFGIDLQLNPDADAFYIDITVTALQNIPQSFMTLHTVIMENSVTGITGDNGETVFESVVKRMLPNSTGYAMEKAWTAGEVVTISYTYNFEDVFDPDELRVVAFVQDETPGTNNKTIYQANIISPVPPEGIDEDIEKQYFDLYPNPATSEINIRPDEQAGNVQRVEIMNSEGRLVRISEVKTGDELLHIPVDNFREGLYLVRLVGSHGIIGSRKLILLGN